MPLLSEEEEPDLSDVFTHQGPRLTVSGTALQQHRGSRDLEVFYLTDSNSQTGVPARLHETKEEKLSRQKVPSTSK